MSIDLDLFFLTVVVMMPSAVELSVLIGVGCWLKPSSWSVMRMVIAICPLWNSPLTSASAEDVNTCLRILHSVWIGPFSGGGRFGDFFGSVGSELSYYCPPVRLHARGYDRYDASLSM